MSSVNVVNNKSFANGQVESSKRPKPSLGGKIAAAFVPHYELKNEIKFIKDKVQKNPAYKINENELSQLKAAFIRGNKMFGNKLLKSLAQLPPGEVHKVILASMEEQEGKANIKPIIEKLLQCLDVESLKGITGLNDQKVKETIQVQKLLKDEAIKNVLAVKGKAIFKELSVEIFYFIHHLIEIVISWTGLIEVKGHSRKNSYNTGEMGAYEAKAKMQAYLALLGYPSLIFASSFAIIGSAAVAALVTGIIAITTLLMIPVYVRYLRPCPKEFDGLNNLNQKVLEAESPPIFKRRDVLMRIQNAFLSGKGVVLTADPGIGKTSVVDSLAELIVTKQCEKFLMKSQVFSANANKLVDAGMGNINFTGLDNTFKRHSKEVVFFFDEIESIFKENILSGKVADSLLTFHDKYRHIVCATTTEQFNNTIKDKENAFNRRFVHIEIKPLDKKELEVALYEYLHYKAPELVIQDDTIPYILEKASEFNPKTSQVDAATSLLTAAIIKSTILTHGKLEDEMNALSLEMDSLKKKLLHRSPTSVNSTEIQKYQRVMKALNIKKAALARKQKELAKIKALERSCLALKHATYKIASEVKNNNPGKTREWLKKQAYYKIQSDFLAQKKIKIGLPTSISKELIDQIIKAG